MITGFWWPDSSTQSWDIKYGSMIFTVWLWSVIAQAFGLKTITNILDTNSTDIGIANVYLTCTSDYMGFVRCVGYAERSSKNQTIGRRSARASVEFAVVQYDSWLAAVLNKTFDSDAIQI